MPTLLNQTPQPKDMDSCLQRVQPGNTSSTHDERKNLSGMGNIVPGGPNAIDSYNRPSQNKPRGRENKSQTTSLSIGGTRVQMGGGAINVNGTEIRASPGEISINGTTIKTGGGGVALVDAAHSLQRRRRQEKRDDRTLGRRRGGRVGAVRHLARGGVPSRVSGEGSSNRRGRDQRTEVGRISGPRWEGSSRVRLWAARRTCGTWLRAR